MALADLDKLTQAPKTVQQWFERYSEEEQTKIKEVLRNPYVFKADVMKALKDDDTNPFPFKASAFNEWATAIIQEGK